MAKREDISTTDSRGTERLKKSNLEPHEMQLLERLLGAFLSLLSLLEHKNASIRAKDAVHWLTALMKVSIVMSRIAYCGACSFSICSIGRCKQACKSDVLFHIFRHRRRRVVFVIEPDGSSKNFPCAKP